MRISILVLVLWFAPARADISPAGATEQIRLRLQQEWQSLVDAEKAYGWRAEIAGQTVSGDWVLHLAGWQYFFDRGLVRCRVQLDVKRMDCGKLETHKPKWSAGPAPKLTVATLRLLHQGIYGKTLSMKIEKDLGHAVVETIVSTPEAATRTSRRYRAHVTFTTETFAIGEPVLVEEYEETCYGVHGCYHTHWNCQRKR